jgi:hypothetical protein
LTAVAREYDRRIKGNAISRRSAINVAEESGEARLNPLAFLTLLEGLTGENAELPASSRNQVVSLLAGFFTRSANRHCDSCTRPQQLRVQVHERGERKPCR